MPRLSMNELTTYRWSFDEDLFHYQQAGYEAIGVWRRKLNDFGEERARELLAESGLAVSNLQWAGGFTGIDGRSHAEAVADGRSAVEQAARIGAGCLVCYTGGRNNHTERHSRRLINAAFSELATVAEQHGVLLAMEPMHSACAGEWSVLTSIREAVDFIAEVGRPSLRLVLDTYHMASPGLAFDQLAEWSDLIALVHLGDWRTPRGVDMTRCRLGEGNAPIREVVSALLDAGYAGDFDVELIGATESPAEYEGLINHSMAYCRQSVIGVSANP
ncbi:MAG: sugar phosphate isomerase/epimerase family protein [Planctomycetota bacterium]